MIIFWKKESGNYMSHGKGLSQDQVDILKKLKVGDRLIIYTRDEKEYPTQSDATLKVFVPKEGL